MFLKTQILRFKQKLIRVLTLRNIIRSSKVLTLQFKQGYALCQDFIDTVLEQTRITQPRSRRPLICFSVQEVIYCSHKKKTPPLVGVCRKFSMRRLSNCQVEYIVMHTLFNCVLRNTCCNDSDCLWIFLCIKIDFWCEMKPGGTLPFQLM